MSHQEIVGEYDWEKGGSNEKYTQSVKINGDGTAVYREFNDTRSQSFERTGNA